MKRTFDANLVDKAVRLFNKNTETVFDPISWVSDHRHVALQNSSDDLALFERELPNVVTGHYYFKSRGKDALKAGRAFLDEIFNPCYNVEVIRGLTPLTNLGARWMSRQIGFKSHGVVKVLDKPFELFILSKKEHAI